MEGPGLLRRESAMPVASATALRRPLMSRWVRVEKVSVRGLPVHLWRSARLRAGSANPPPSSIGWITPIGTTVETREGPTARIPP